MKWDVWLDTNMWDDCYLDQAVRPSLQEAAALMEARYPRFAGRLLILPKPTRFRLHAKRVHRTCYEFDDGDDVYQVRRPPGHKRWWVQKNFEHTLLRHEDLDRCMSVVRQEMRDRAWPTKNIRKIVGINPQTSTESGIMPPVETNNRPTITPGQTTRRFDMSKDTISLAELDKQARAAKKAKGNKGKAKAKKEKAPPKPKIGATEAELAAAVAGNLKPRDEKGSKGQESLGLRTGDDSKPVGRPIGLTTGLPILLAWCYIFQQNQKATKAQRKTDEQISKWMKAEFPGRKTAAFDNVNGCRIAYNGGRYTKEVEPKVQSQRFDENGEVVVVKRGAKTAAKKKAAASKPRAAASKPTPPRETAAA